MVRLIESRRRISLDDYEGVASLSAQVRDLRREAPRLLPALSGRRVWMLNSTGQGGGVAELLPPLLSILCELGVDARWLVMETEAAGFFPLTKRLHNLIHSRGDPHLGETDRELYDRVSRETADAIAARLSPGDVLVAHDPQPMGAGALLRREHDIAAIWRCHIGLDQDTPQTEAAWRFLDACAQAYDLGVFSAAEYIPRCLAGRATVIPPGIDPLSHKNRELPIHKLIGVLANGALIPPYGPVLTPPFPDAAQRLESDGRWAPASEGEDIGLLFRPIVTQVSRWDRLKGFLPLMQGFVALKQERRDGLNDRDRRTLELARLVLAGPETSSVADDPEANDALAEICTTYRSLPEEARRDIAVVTLPMRSRKRNALLVNALQRCSDVVAQNSLQEGFGLTATEAMWKRVTVMGTRAAGLRQQIRHGLDGCLVENPEDSGEIARTLADLLCDQPRRDALARSAQQRVQDQFLVFAQARRWLEVLADTVRARWL